MNNTTLILVLAVGGIAVYALTRDKQKSTETIVIKQKELSTWEKAGGLAGDAANWAAKTWG